MATDYTRQWIQFFTGCGIPEDVATTYGLIFNENRIQKNMLLELNKEYLKDMGITVMGDVIAILRHAKVMHDKYVRDQILLESEETIENYELSGGGLKKTSTKRILNHYTRKYETSEVDVPHEKVQIQIQNDNSSIKIPDKSTPHISPQNKVTVKKKIEAPSMINDELMPVKPVVPLPKVRRVLPENEGNYKIKMPSGTTERSKKILEKAKLKTSKTVFERLGESSVSSTSDVTTTSSTTQIVKPSAPKEKNFSSVFARLGEKSPLVTSTSSNGDSAIAGDQLPYRGILKTKVEKKLGYLPGSTMRADNELQKSQANDNRIKKINLKERLGTTAKTAQPSLQKNTIKLNRLQITTTFEEDVTESEPSQVKTLSTRFKSIKPTSGEGNMEKNASDCLGSFRSEAIQKKSRVSSTTQLTDGRPRGVKRRLESTEPVASETCDMVQSKKVRFGRTTQRLIPGNPTEIKGAIKEYANLTMMIGHKMTGKKLDKLTLTSGMKIGQMNSDKIRQKLSLKERIGSGSLQPKPGRIATELKRKRSLKLTNRTKKNAISIHDRLG